MNRKKFLKSILQLSAITAVPLFYSWQIEPFWVEFTHKKLPVRFLPTHLEGKTLMQISDLHVGNRFDWHFLIDSFKEAKKYSPDFVVYTGDFVNTGNLHEQNDLKHVLEHAVFGNLGTVGILGNHDYGRNWQEMEVAKSVTDICEKAGINILINEKKEISGLTFLGLGDLWSTEFFPEKIMKNHNPQRANIVLAHNPDTCDLEIWENYKGWILSGHTHGGQCRIPGVLTPILPVRNKKYISGEINLNDGRTLYINRALGHSFQIRFMVRPEITIFKLTNTAN